MTDRLIPAPTSTPVTPAQHADTPVKQEPGDATVERPGQHGPLSGTTGRDIPPDPATPGKAGSPEGQK